MRSAMVIDCGGWPLMTTAGRRPDSMRAMRAASAGSGASAAADCWSGAWALERLLAESFGEGEEEREAATARSANAAVKSIRIFVVVDLMGANRTTFECQAIRLVG